MKKMPLAIPSNMHLKIRKANREDARGVWNLIVQLQEFLRLESSPYEEFAPRWEEALDSPNFEAFVAEERGDIKGLATVWYRESLSHGGLVALIDEFVVTEGERGKGVGTCLLKYVVNHCFRRGCIEVEVITEADNFAARGFYHKLGFYEVGILLERGKNEGE
ncbi:MAG: GNAT family N-acetyltransferase [Anaerolineae bacterium]|nr:GNAT family N-acetyltransferase [Anaerolineae bacterium]